ncbi:MAG TPA: MFS transporter [Verrucomicrobiae bacterium]|jgi:predicted MFS family arabinose efflux permease
MNSSQKVKFACFAIEGLNSFSTILYFNYLYFLMHAKFGFSDQQNLALAALLGSIYAIAAWQGGRIAHRLGYFNTLKLGFGIMILAWLVGAQLTSAPALVVAACIANIGMCLTWPTLEALVSEGESAANVPRVVGIYNIVWAVTYAGAFFVGGRLIDDFGFKAIFYIPAGVMAGQMALAFWLEHHASELKRATAKQPTAPALPPDPHRPSPAKAKAFLRMAWLANPFAYIAINTLIAVLPGVAAKLHLSTSIAGVVCSLWCFARLAAFVVLWRWSGWHYRFRWLLVAFGLLVTAFVAILTVPVLSVILLAQLLFGGAIGLIYYSSLYYSMDVSEVKSEHGGIHEAAIGLGNCLGPAVGALSLQFAARSADSAALGVAGLLSFGLAALVWIQINSREHR